MEEGMVPDPMVRHRASPSRDEMRVTPCALADLGPGNNLLRVRERLIMGPFISWPSRGCAKKGVSGRARKPAPPRYLFPAFCPRQKEVLPSDISNAKTASHSRSQAVTTDAPALAFAT